MISLESLFSLLGLHLKVCFQTIGNSCIAPVEDRRAELLRLEDAEETREYLQIDCQQYVYARNMRNKSRESSRLV